MIFAIVIIFPCKKLISGTKNACLLKLLMLYSLQVNSLVFNCKHMQAADRDTLVML